jgi:hypothetical protein
MLVVALLVATFIASTFTTSANTTVLEGVELKLGHTIGFVYYSKQEYTENTVMRFEINGRITDVPAIPNDQTCAFVFNDIYPHELAHEIKTTIFVDGKPVVSYPAFSMREYLLSELLKIEDPNDPHCKLVSNLLQYGEATREYRNANVDASERDDVEILDFDMSIYTTYNPDNLNTLLSETANNLGVSTNDIHLSSIGISYYNTNKYVVTLVIPDDVSVPMEKIVVSIDNVEYRMDDDTNSNIKNPQPGVYEIYSDPIHANEVFNYSPVIKLSVNGNEVQNISYSCKDYVLHLQQLEPNTLAENYAQALYYYGEWASKVYQNPTVIALGPLKKPNDIILKNSQPHQPTGGLGAAYMSDGSIQEVELKWGFVEAITDDTYKVEREVVGQYKDSITGRVYSAKSTVTLLNPLKEIQRWTDPSNITPDINATKYIINDAEVKAIWSNGYSEVRTANPYTLTNSAYERCLAICKQISIQYTDPKSNVTCTLPEPVFLYIDNPIISISTEQTSSLLFANTSGSIYVDKSSFTYTITQASGYSFTTTAADLMGQWNVSANTPVYKGNDETGTITVNWRATFRYPDGWIVEGQYKNGQVQPDYTLQAHQPINWSCEAEFYNPITEIELAGDPSCTLTSTELPTSENKMLSGGIVIAYRANGASEKLANSLVQYAAEATIIDTTYSKKVVYVATYQGLQDSGIITITNPIKENSLVQDLNGKMHVYASHFQQTYTTAKVSHFSNGLQVTYANGVTANVTPTGFYVGASNASKTEFYTHNIQDASRKSSLYTDGWISQTLTSSSSNNSIRAIYTDNRPGVTGVATMTCNISYYVINAPTDYGEQDIDVLTSKNKNDEYITPQATIYVYLMNDTEAPITVTLDKMPNYSGNKDMEQTEGGFTYIENHYELRWDGYVLIHNPVVEILSVDSDPQPIEVTSTNAVTSADIKKNPGSLNVVLYNGQTGYVSPKQFTNLSNAKITDTTMIKSCTITATYKSQWKDADEFQIPMTLILLNPPVDASVSLNYGSSSNKLVLGTTAKEVTFTQCKIKYSNGQLSSSNLIPDEIPQIFKNGETTDGTATTIEVGEKEVTVSISYDESETCYCLDTGDPLDHTIPAGTVSKKVTVYWKNTVKFIDVTNIKCISTTGGADAMVTPTNVKVTVSYNNGAKATDKSASAEQVKNLTGFTNVSASRDADITYEAKHGQKYILKDYEFTIYNPITSISYAPSSNKWFEETKLVSSSSTTASNVYEIHRASGSWGTIGNPDHTTTAQQTPWLNMNLSSSNSAVSFTSNNTATPTIKYTGSSVEVTINCTATLNSNAVRTPYDTVTTCTHTIKLINTPKAVASYSSAQDSTASNSLKVDCWYGNTAPTIEVTVNVVGANGKNLGTTKLSANNTLKKGNGSQKYTNQNNNNSTNTYSAECEKAVTFIGTFGGYDLDAVISCYTYNEFYRYEYYTTKLYRKASSGYSPSDFSASVDIVKTYKNGYNTLETSSTVQADGKFYTYDDTTDSKDKISVNTISHNNVRTFTTTTHYSSIFQGTRILFAIKLPQKIYYNVDGVGGVEEIYVYNGPSSTEQFLKDSFTDSISDFYYRTS